jgi:hypothetical protein
MVRQSKYKEEYGPDHLQLRPGPWSWPDPQNKLVGQEAQEFYHLLEAIYDEDKPARKDIIASAEKSEGDLRNYMKKEWQIEIPGDLRILVVDIQNARMIHHVPAIDPTKHSFYVMVIPPPIRIKDDNYRHWQALSGAWFHAINDGWGM